MKKKELLAELHVIEGYWHDALERKWTLWVENIRLRNQLAEIKRILDERPRTDA